MVVPVPRVAYIVEEMEDDEVIELFVARTGIELFAARLAASSITDAEIAYLEENLRGMEDALKGGEVDKLAGLDTLFHQTVAEAGQNRYLVQATQLLVQKTLRVSSACIHIPEIARKTLEGHSRVIEALKGRDEKRVEEAMLSHLEDVKNQISKYLEGIRKRAFIKAE